MDVWVVHGFNKGDSVVHVCVLTDYDKAVQEKDKLKSDYDYVRFECFYVNASVLRNSVVYILQCLNDQCTCDDVHLFTDKAEAQKEARKCKKLFDYVKVESFHVGDSN